MNGITRLLAGHVVYRLRSAAPEQILNRLTERKIPFWDARQEDRWTLRLSCFYRDAEKLEQAARQAQAETEQIFCRRGLLGAKRLLRRPALLLGLFLCLAAVTQLPNYVWFCMVSGNDKIPQAQILQAADALGVHFGARSTGIDSQEIKNQLLAKIPQLQWAAVNCSGGVCEILVKERAEKPALLDRRLACDVVASRDGTIVDMQVLEGQALCQVGDTVQAGQTLVSGVNDFVVNLQKTHAQAEIYALTQRTVRSVIPLSYVQYGSVLRSGRVYYLQIGKCRIKLSGSSSIPVLGCDKIITRNALTLPGGWTLPVTLIVETWQLAQCEPELLHASKARQILSSYSTEFVQQDMVAGEIHAQQGRLSAQKGCYESTLLYACQEMIALEREVNLYGSEQQDDGTDFERVPDRTAERGIRDTG